MAERAPELAIARLAARSRGRGASAGVRAGLRRSFPVDPDSRRRTEELLAGLRAGRWRPSAWGWFLGRAAVMSWQAAAARPRATAEVTALHAALLVLARCSGRKDRAWIAASWLLAVTHLGLLGPRGSLGAANAVTLARASLPALGSGPWTGVAALAADVLDGQLARRHADETMFGSYADTIADAAFWTWFTARHETSGTVRAAAFAAWAVPGAAALALSVARGTVTAPPRHELLRPAAPVAVLLVARAFARSRRDAATGLVRDRAAGRRPVPRQ